MQAGGCPHRVVGPIESRGEEVDRLSLAESRETRTTPARKMRVIEHQVRDLAVVGRLCQETLSVAERTVRSPCISCSGGHLSAGSTQPSAEEGRSARPKIGPSGFDQLPRHFVSSGIQQHISGLRRHVCHY